jgi:FkbM family methyltransferase
MSLETVRTFLYRFFRQFFLLTWKIAGGRKLDVFGERLIVDPVTIFPSYRSMRLPQRHVFEKLVRYGDFVQMHSLYLYLLNLADAPVVIDAGAHHGAYAVVLGKLVQKKKGKLIAVEPNPRAFTILQRNIYRNKLEDTVVCENVALFDQEEKVSLVDLADQSKISQSSSGSEAMIDAVTLKMLIDKYLISSVDLLLVDVEGAELSVLRGFPWNDCSVKRIFCEMHPYAWEEFHYTPHDMSQFLIEHRLRCFDMLFREHSAFDNSEYIGPTFLFR